MGKLSQVREAIPSGGRAVFTAYNKKIADDIALKLAQPRKNFQPSPQQEVIFEWVRDPDGAHPTLIEPSRNAMIEAVAGAGKTTTLIEVCHLLNMQVSSSTFHSIGFRAWQNAVGQVKVNSSKVEDLMEEHDVPRHLRAFVGKLVSLAKQRGIGTSLTLGSTQNDEDWIEIIEHFDLEELLPQFSSVEEGITTARSILHESIAEADKVVDFEDMIYMPLQAGVQIPQFDWVLVDEYQDTNPTRRELARRMLAEGGRFVGVGDPHQAIYGFTGADNDAMDLGVRLFDCVRLPLTVTYRCPKAVVRHAQQWVSHIQAHPSAPEGAVRSITLKEFSQILDLTGTGRGFGNKTTDVLSVSDAILCRNTRPLIETAFDLIRRRIPCHVEGRDIGQGLISLVKKWKGVQRIDQLRDKLEEYLEMETRKFLKRGRKDKAASLQDKVGTLMVFMQSLHDNDTTYKLIESINSLFKDTETGKKAATVTLSTIHKAKGREWKRVYWLGRNTLQPSPYARQAWELAQEWNLCYVAATRPMEELIEVVYPLPGVANPGEYEKDEEAFSVAEPRLAKPDVQLGGITEEYREDDLYGSHGAAAPRLARTVTGRLHSKINPQNISYPEEYKVIQETTEAVREGGEALAREAENRLIAWLADQQKLLDGGLTNDSELG
jgi:DNA helicase-2/ATP-dependent DNA helicase PcrA